VTLVQSMMRELDRLRAENSDLRADLRSKEIAFREYDTVEAKLQDWANLHRKVEAENAELRRHLEEAKSGWRVVSG